MRRLMIILFAVALVFAFLISPSISQARYGYGWHGWGWYHGGYYRGYYGPGYWGYYPRWYYPYYWGFPIGGWPFVGWPYAAYAGWPYLGWPYYAPEVTAAPPAYSKPGQQQPSYWYYCQNPQGYYPYVKSCPGGWIPVVPNVTPPGQ